MTHLKNFSDGTDAIDALNVDNIKIDGNTISSTDTNGDITLDPNGTGDVVVASGKLGVGTTTPSANIEISNDGNAKLDIVDTGSGDPAVRLSVANSAGYVGTTTNHPLRIITNDTERLNINADGTWGKAPAGTIIQVKQVDQKRSSNSKCYELHNCQRVERINNAIINFKQNSYHC